MKYRKRLYSFGKVGVWRLVHTFEFSFGHLQVLRDQKMMSDLNYICFVLLVFTKRNVSALFRIEKYQLYFFLNTILHTLLDFLFSRGKKTKEECTDNSTAAAPANKSKAGSFVTRSISPKLLSSFWPGKVWQFLFCLRNKILPH